MEAPRTAGGSPAVMEQVVELARAGRSYLRGSEEVRALDELSLAMATGELVALVGPSGCGKSTALNLVAAVDRPDRGTVRVCGIDVATASEAELVTLRRRRIGMVFQAFHLVPHLTVEENVALPLALDGRRDPARVTELMRRVGLEHRRRHYPSELSGGEQQRTAVARALVHRPRVVVADEPTGNLDSRTGATVLELLDELRREAGVALLLATHDARVAAAADRVLELADGRLVG
ncbi:MAG TPA: ABC transporter ATP-binding protein [Candidatus Sulfomarinibacteraceae bacterium]|nr:ABC transporter ATP-binding protein [Candidatus Sulfomarinibacteraceae bacterium]